MNKDEIKIVLASDHAGFELKNYIKDVLEKDGYSVLDVGAHNFVPEDDFSVYISSASLKVAEDLSNQTKAIIFGGSGQGEAITANRYPGVRAVVWYGNTSTGNDFEIIKLSREHNDSNILSIGARFVDKEEAKKAVSIWLKTPFSNKEKYQRRNEQIDSME